MIGSTCSRLVGYALLLLGCASTVPMHAGVMGGIPKNLIESGMPSFVVLGPESLGLSRAPTDLRILPDGRLLAVSKHEIAFGDGVRWQTFQSRDDKDSVIGTDKADRIFGEGGNDLLA